MSRQAKTLISHQTTTAANTFSSLLQRKCACGTHTLGGGACDGCHSEGQKLKSAAVNPAEALGVRPDNQTRSHSVPRFAQDFSRIPVYAETPLKIHPKLTVNTPGDEYEQEADRTAAIVMRMPESRQQLARPREGGYAKCPEEYGVREHLQAKAVRADDTGGTEAPPIVHETLRSPGQPLDSATRDFMEPRFGHDFGGVRVHTDAKAAESARSVNALAYTVERDIVFGAYQYQPGTRDGQHLLVHELAHVVQQDQAPIYAVQRTCRSAAQCAAPSAGSATRFGASVEAESEAIAVASGGGAPAPPGGHASCNLPRHGQRATNLEALATGAGLGATIAPGIDGYFINACLSPRDGANNALCSDFPGGPPAGTHATNQCVQVHTTDEDQATALRARPRPLGDADLRNFLFFTSLIAHESQHIRFEARSGTIVPPATDCNLSTPVPPRGTVETLLSEISAEVGAFDVYFRNATANPSRSSTFAMQSFEHDTASRGDENILGNIRDLQCVCECNTVDTFVEEVFNDASALWTLGEKREFKRAMTEFIPSFWPRSLHQR